MNQLTIICFDVCDKKRLRQVAIQLENIGQRIQYSVFECYLNNKKLTTLKKRLTAIINPEEDDIRYYSICNKDKQKIIIDGVGSLTQDNDYYLL